RKIQLYPKGYSHVKDTHVSLYLTLANPEKLSPASEILAQSIKRQALSIQCFSASGPPSWGWPDFITLGNFKQRQGLFGEGYLLSRGRGHCPWN
ncbi:unnamed protein product, partial [Prunus brigantina]